MAANSVQFTATPRIGMAQISAANTNRDGTGTVVDIITGVAAGTYIKRVTIKATVTTTAGMVRLYLHDGTNTRLYAEVDVVAFTVSATVKSFSYQVEFPDGLILPSASWVLRASTHNAETFNVIAEGADY